MIKKRYFTKLLLIVVGVILVGGLGLTINLYNKQNEYNKELRSEIEKLKEELSNNQTQVKSDQNDEKIDKEVNKKEKLEEEYKQVDEELNKVWQQIVNYKADYPKVIQKQKEWIKYKDSKDLSTKIIITKQRIEALRKWFSYQIRIQGRNGAQFALENPEPSLDW